MLHDLDAIGQALDADDLESAALLAKSALERGIEDALVFNLAAWRAEQAGQLGEAEAIMRRALRRYPDDASLHLGLGVTLRALGRLKEAVDAIETAIALDPDYAAAWQERGATFEHGGSLDDAIADYRKAVSIEPGNADALAALANALARHGTWIDAREYAQRAVAADGSNPRALTALARLALEDRKYDDAIDALSFIAAEKAQETELLVSAYTLLGDAYDGAMRFAEAYEAYGKAQAIFRAIHMRRSGTDRQDSQSVLDRLSASFARADPGDWISASETNSPAKTHVFLTGYPRSGTTLVENILATLPGTVAIEERPTLADIDDRFLNDPHGVADFSRLPETALHALREKYWQRAEKAAGEPVKDRLFVDMDPFKGSLLPFIARLFPQARLIVMRRDPRDVVWSCFRTNFAYNAGTMAFTSLEQTARHYARTWDIIERALDTLPIDHFDLRYDALVHDFDRTTQRLCAYLGVTWDERLRNFDRTAQVRGVSTASVGQVRRGLYDGSGRWRRYESQMTAIQPILAPWIEKFEAGDR